MSHEQHLERALQRERKARSIAEQHLENKSRELYLLNEELRDNVAMLSRKNDELALYADLANFAEQDVDTAVILQYYLQQVSQFNNWPLSHIYLVENDYKQVRLKSSQIWYYQTDTAFSNFREVTEHTTFASGEGLPGKVFQAKAAQWLENIFQNSSLPRSQVGSDCGLKGAYGLPIVRYGEVIAVAEFFSQNSTEDNDFCLSVARAAARQISILLERRYSEKQIQEQYAELKQTHDSLKNTQSQLLQSSKLASIGQLAAGVAHEINNPISFVANNTRVLKKYAKSIQLVFSQLDKLMLASDDIEQWKLLACEYDVFLKKNNIQFILEDLVNLVGDSLDGMQRVTDIVAGLKSFSRVDEADMKQVSINDCIESTIKIIWNQIKYHCELNKELNKLPEIECYPSQLNQVFMNLLINAGQAIEDKGVIDIKSFQKDSDIFIEVTDNGVGISPENMQNIFDPFFTTKPVGTGTGLGLSISYGIIQKHGGDILVDSEPGRGTTFSIRLPISNNS